MDTRDILVFLFGALIAFIFAYGLWHPNNNNYVSREDYDSLNKSYVQLQQENEDLKKDMGELILEYYGKTFTPSILGLGKHRLAFCAVQKYIIGKIPILGEIC